MQLSFLNKKLIALINISVICFFTFACPNINADSKFNSKSQGSSIKSSRPQEHLTFNNPKTKEVSSTTHFKSNLDFNSDFFSNVKPVQFYITIEIVKKTTDINNILKPYLIQRLIL